MTSKGIFQHPDRETDTAQIPSLSAEKEKQVKKAFRFLFLLSCIFATTNTLEAQWIQTNGPDGGFVVSLTVSGPNLLAGTNGGGVFLSTNHGTSWTAVNNGLTIAVIRPLAVSGPNLFAGTFGGGIFLSTN